MEMLEAPNNKLAVDALKDPYIFDFITMTEEMNERDIEKQLVKKVTKLLLELGSGFAFIGNQYKLQVGGDDYYLDLLFYNLKLRCYVVVELKTGKFKPEYAGKLNFYLSVVDDILKTEVDNPSIGIILCKEENKLVAEYSLKDMTKPIGVSEYKLLERIPEELKGTLPSIAQPWHELAKAYDRNGQPSDARFLRLSAARRTTRHSPRWSKPPRWGYGLLVGYGYLPLLAGGWLIAALLTAWLISSTHRAAFLPNNPAALQSALASRAPASSTNPQGLSSSASPLAAISVTGATSCRELHGAYPCLRPLLYSLEVVLPPTVTTGQSTAWRPTQDWIAYTLIGLKTFGWLLTALLIAGVTGLLRKT